VYKAHLRKKKKKGLTWKAVKAKLQVGKQDLLRKRDFSLNSSVDGICLFIIQQIVTMPIYGKEALNICHPYMTDN